MGLNNSLECYSHKKKVQQSVFPFPSCSIWFVDLLSMKQLIFLSPSWFEISLLYVSRICIVIVVRTSPHSDLFFRSHKKYYVMLLKGAECSKGKFNLSSTGLEEQKWILNVSTRVRFLWHNSLLGCTRELWYFTIISTRYFYLVVKFWGKCKTNCRT